jgi:hypothetical protein
MKATLALLGQGQSSPVKNPAPVKNKAGRPSKSSKGGKQDDRTKPFRDFFVLEVMERERASGKSRGQAKQDAIKAWKRKFPMSRLSETEVNSVLALYQPEKSPFCIRVVEPVKPPPELIVDGVIIWSPTWKQTWLSFGFDERPEYPKRGSGTKHKFNLSKKTP